MINSTYLQVVFPDKQLKIKNLGESAKLTLIVEQEIKQEAQIENKYNIWSKIESQVGLDTDADVNWMGIEVRDEDLLFEQQCPVTFFSCVSNVLFRCRLSHLGPFQQCCLNKIFCCTWHQLAKFMGYGLFSLTLASPYIARVLIFKFIEYEEWFQRKEAAGKYDLRSSFSQTLSLLTYFSPWHYLYIIISVIVVIFFLFISVHASFSKKCCKSLLPVRKVFFQSFCFRKRMDLNACYIYRLFVQNLVYPFNDRKVYCEDYSADRKYHQMDLCVEVNKGKKCSKKYKAGQRIFNFICWPFVVVFTTVACLCFHFPTTYIIYRMFYQALHESTCAKLTEQRENTGKRKYQIVPYKDHTLSLLMFGKNPEYPCNCNCRLNYISSILVAIVCTIGMLCVLLLFSECVAFAIEMAVFTLIGLIVHSNELIEYVSLLFILLMYVFSCFKAVAKPYDELQNDIFATVQSMLKSNKISSVTNACKHRQENEAFFYPIDYAYKKGDCKVCTDETTSNTKGSDNQLPWKFHRLLLFINNEDCPLIPRKIFDEMCRIRTYGFPGPVHENTARAIKQLIQIMLFLVFVFFAVRTFGPYYDTSIGTDMILIAASGLLPKLLQVAKGVKSKRASNCHDSITYYEIKKQAILNNYCQTWTVSDIHFGTGNGESDNHTPGAVSGGSETENEHDRLVEN